MSERQPEADAGPRDEPPDDFLKQAWPWAVYISPAGIYIHHELTDTRLRDLHEAAKKLNAYHSAWQAALRASGTPAPPTDALAMVEAMLESARKSPADPFYQGQEQALAVVRAALLPGTPDQEVSEDAARRRLWEAIQALRGAEGADQQAGFINLVHGRIAEYGRACVDTARVRSAAPAGTPEPETPSPYFYTPGPERTRDMQRLLERAAAFLDTSLRVTGPWPEVTDWLADYGRLRGAEVSPAAPEQETPRRP